MLKHQEGRSIFDRTARHPGRRWFFFFQLLALVGFPIVFMFARHLPDAGWGLSRPLAMLLLGYGAWIIPSLGWAPFSRGLTLALFAVILGASAYAAWRQRAAIAEAITQRWKWMLGCELVYLAIFGFYLTIRMHNPDVYWGEKPMDLSFLAATYRSEYFPLRDPWYAGHAVNYYYLGHTLVAATGKLLNIGVEFLYNLAAATVPALVGAAAFSIILHACRRAWAATAGAYLLTVGGSLWSAAIWFYNHSPQFRTDNSRYHELARRVFVDGNVDWSAAFGHLWQILKSGVIFYSGPPIQEARFDDGFFWRAGHDIIPNTRTAANEFPSWTYLFADLHAHMLVMPLVLLFIGTALAMLGLPADRRPHRRWCALGCLSLTLGAIICVNTWDLPASALLLLFVLLWQMFHVKHSNQLPLNAGTWGRRALLAAGNLGFSVILPLGMVVIGAFALYAPFHVNFVSRVEVGLGAVQRSWGSNTPPDIFALIFGAMLFFVAWYLIARLWQPNIEEDATACSLLNEGGWVGSNAAASSRSPRSLLNKGGWGGSPEADVWRARFIRLCLFAALLLFGLLASRYYSLPSVRQALVNIHHLTHPVTLDYRLLALLLPFVVWAMWYGLASRRPGEAATAALAWVGLGIAAGVEFFFIQETWGYPEHRYNTVFKFYLQVWTYLALAAGAAMGLLIRFRSRPESDDLPAQARRLGRTALVLFGFGVLLPLTLVFPIVGSYTITRGIGSKTNNGDIPGLDGLSWFKKQDPDNYWAMKWLTFNIPGQPTVLEAPGTSYWHETSRISTMTGLPTILGWPHHSKERSHPDPEVSQRERDAIAIYSSQDKRRVVRLLQDYGVDYIYVGAQELRRFGNVHRKFSRYGDVLDVVYRRGEYGVYQVRRNLSAEYMTEVEEVAPADEPAQAGMSLLEGGDGFGYGQFREPRGIRFDGSRFFVADTFNHRVQVFAPDGKFLFAFGESGGGESQFREPNDVITDASGRIIVLDTWNGRIQVFDPKGRFAAVWTEGIGYGPRAIARDPASGRLYLADTGNGQVRMLSPEGGLLRVYGERGAGPGRFSNPTGIAFHDGRVYVLDRDNRRVVVLDAELRYLADWPVDYPPGDLMGEPKLAVTPEGRVLVSDAFKGRILVYDPDGRPVAVLGTGQLVAPTGLTLGPGGLVYASDMRAHRILALRLPQ
ncbi:hypothetical protein HS125_11950 [bacterium]|nr:hypothetical protein [bacterium]